MSESFLPQGYVAPASGGFAKIEQGDNPFRILSNPLLVWVAWNNKVVTRTLAYQNGALTEKPTVPAAEGNSVNFAWAVVVWNYKTSKIEILELTAKAVQTGIEGYAKDANWGHPSKYDVIIVKTGTGKLDTKYSLRTNPPQPVTDAIKVALAETPIDLNQLLVNGGNPFLNAAGSPASTPQAPPQKVVTPENYVAGDPIPQGYVLDPNGALTKSGLPF